MTSTVIIVVAALVGAAISIGATFYRTTPHWADQALVRVGRPASQGVLGTSYTDPAYVDRVLRTIADISSQSPGGNVCREFAGASGAVAVQSDTELLGYSSAAPNPRGAARCLSDMVRAGRDRTRAIYGDSLAFTVVPGSVDRPRHVARPLLLAGAGGALAGLVIATALLLWRSGARRRAP